MRSSSNTVWSAVPCRHAVDPRLAGLLLELWRVREHGDVAAVLHNTKELSESAVVDALNSTKDVNYSYKSVAQALMPLDKAGAPMVLKTYEGPEGKELVAFVRLRHAPYEYVVVTARYNDGKYRVVRIDSVVDR